MKYFIDAKARTASGHENYIEFQIPGCKEEFWDDDSLYMSEEVLNETGFCKFWTDCVYNNIVFDMDTISHDEMLGMLEAARSYENTVLEIIKEFKTWAEVHFCESDQYIGVIWEYDRILSNRRNLEDNV